MASGGIPDIAKLEEALRESERALEHAKRDALKQRHRLLMELMTAREKERSRIASGLHDDAIQMLNAAKLKLDLLDEELESPEHHGAVAGVAEALQRTIENLRNLIFELRPPILEEAGLAAALRAYLDHVEGPGGPRSRFTDALDAEPPPEVAMTVYRIAREALNNVKSHAQARNVELRVEQRAGGVAASVRDDGVGLSPDLAPPPEHIGLTAMRELAELAGGWFRLESAPGKGTTVSFYVPEEGVPAAG